MDQSEIPRWALSKNQLPSTPWGRGWPAAGAFTSRSRPGEGVRKAGNFHPIGWAAGPWPLGMTPNFKGVICSSGHPILAVDAPHDGAILEIINYVYRASILRQSKHIARRQA